MQLMRTGSNRCAHVVYTTHNGRHGADSHTCREAGSKQSILYPEDSDLVYKEYSNVYFQQQCLQKLVRFM